MSLNFKRVRELLSGFQFTQLFVEELGWSPAVSAKAVKLQVKDASFTGRQVAELAGAVVLELGSPDGGIPDAATRAAVAKAVEQSHHENILLFVDKERSQSLWYWVKREEGKRHAREHLYLKGQPGDLFVSKLGQMCFDLSEFDEDGRVSLAQVAQKIHDALNVEPVTKKFYKEYQEQHLEFIELIQGVDDEKQRRWYASVLLNRLMFIYFLQKKGFVDGGKINYLREKLAWAREQGKDRFFEDFLKPLFFEGFAKPSKERSREVQKLLGDIRYLNGGLFLPHRVEMDNPKLQVPDKAFENIFGLFERYSWNLNDTPGGSDDEINPDVLGYIFEKYINQKAFGAYYTRPEITEYLCERTIHRLLLDAVEKVEPGKFSDIGALLMGLDARLCKLLLLDTLPRMSLLDPACGSGAFLVAAMKVLVDIYSAVLGKIPFLKSAELKLEVEQIQREHKSLPYFIKKRIITDNLFGVDIMEEATEIARLRLFLALVSSADHVDQLEPLPNIDFNILPGNSLIGLLQVDADQFEATAAPEPAAKKLKLPPEQAKMPLATEGGKNDLPGMTFESGGPTLRDLAAKHVRSLQTKKLAQILEEKNRLIDTYRHAATYGKDLTAQRENIAAQKRASYEVLNKLLLFEFQALGIKYEQATWDTKKNQEGKTEKRALGLDDIRALRPFHWGYEFDEILNKRGGFDAIITNPPWEIFKPNAKEFFLDHSELISKKKMSIHDFEKQQAVLLQDSEVRRAWLEYLSEFPHLSAFYRGADQFKNQISVVNGKKAGTDINLYKLFVEQCHNLLRRGGRTGIILPSGIYTDLGTKQLREMLFSASRTDSIIGLSNERFIFENVHHAFKFCLVVFEKGGVTEEFRGAFRINPREAIAAEGLEAFLNAERLHQRISTSLVRKLSPDSLSVMEFRNDMDIRIANKMLQFPLLGEEIEEKWNLRLTAEFHMTNDSHLFKERPGKGRLPLYEGKMIWHFDHLMAEPRYWVEEKAGRKAVLGRTGDSGGPLDYQKYRLAFRDVAASTNERSAISTIIPPGVFAGNTLPVSTDESPAPLSLGELTVFCSVFNSFVFDAFIRKRITSHLNMFYVYQMPVPRLAIGDSAFRPIVDRAARLICTTPEFDDLAKEVGLGSHREGATDPGERARLRAELDGLVAHLYGLTEEEFAYILTTFPVVAQGVKDAALAAYREFAPKSEDEEAAALVRAGEGKRVEFKATARWDVREGKANKEMERVVVEEVAAFMNSEGGTLLIGVADEGTAAGLARDFQVFSKKKTVDAYENWLVQLLLNAFGQDVAPCVAVSFPKVDGVEICRVEVQAAPRAVYVTLGNDEHLLVRAGNSKKRLTTKEAVAYVKERWG